MGYYAVNAVTMTRGLGSSLQAAEGNCPKQAEASIDVMQGRKLHWGDEGGWDNEGGTVVGNAIVRTLQALPGRLLRLFFLATGFAEVRLIDCENPCFAPSSSDSWL